MRFLWLASAAISGLACAAPPSASALELIGQAGILGEWELTANLEAAGGKQEFAGPITLKHTGICTTNEPEKRSGDIRLQMIGASRIKAALTIEGNPCTYSGSKSDAYVGTMSCRDRRDVPLRLWVK
jgi:hypothetical protein